MKTYIYLIAIIIYYFSLNTSNAQLTDYPRGMYVDRFFSFSGDRSGGSHTEADIDHNITILGNPNKEAELLQYAKDHHITYLVLYDVHKLINDLNMMYNGKSLGQHFCDFINNAKQNYCVDKIGVAGASEPFFNDIASNFRTTPIAFNTTELAQLQGNPLLMVQNNSFTTDAERQLAEILKFYLRVANFNRANAARFGASFGSGAICSPTAHVDVLVTEYEFWNTATGPIPSNWHFFSDIGTGLVEGMDGIKIITPDLYVETYLGILEHVNVSTWTTSGNKILTNPVAVAQFIDGLYSPSVKRVDRIMNNYYSSSNFFPTPHIYDPFMYDNTQGLTSFYQQCYYNQRFLPFCDPSTEPNSIIQPSFSVENSYYNHNNSALFLGNWFSQNRTNNIWTYEKYFYDDWIDDLTANVHDPVNQNNLSPGAVTWFSSPFLIEQKQFQNPFISNSPVCDQEPINFTYQGPIEDGLSYEFFVKDDVDGTTVLSVPIASWNPYSPVYSVSHNHPYLITLPTNVVLPAGNYTAHLKLNYNSNCSKEFTQAVKVNSNLQIYPSVSEVCGQTLFAGASGESVIVRVTEISGAIYVWDVNGSAQISNSNEMVYLPLKNTSTTDRSDPIRCVVTGTSGCLSSSSQTVIVDVTIHPNFDSQLYVDCNVLLGGIFE